MVIQTEVENTQSQIIKKENIQTSNIVHQKKQQITIQSIVNDNFQCRICLQNANQSKQPFIKPCECSGTLTYVHQSCFTQWMKRMVQHKNDQQMEKLGTEGIKCQLCKMKFQLKINYDKICINWQRLKLRIKRLKTQFIFLCAFLIISIVLLIVGVIFMPSDIFNVKLGASDQNTQSSMLPYSWQKVIYLVCYFFLFIILGFTCYLLIDDFGFTYRVEFAYKGKQIKTMKGILDQ